MQYGFIPSSTNISAVLSSTETPERVALTCEPDMNNPANICAMELLHHPDGSPKGLREAIIDRTHAVRFMADCNGWDADSFEQSCGLVVSMAREAWDRWLALTHPAIGLNQEASSLQRGCDTQIRVNRQVL